MDDSLIYLRESRDYLNMIIPISLADSFFEDTDENKEINENNNKAKSGALASLKKAFATLIAAIKQSIANIANFFQEKFMSSEDKEKYKKFKEMVKSNPEFGNMKITLVNFREYEKAYDEALKQLDEEAKKEEPSETISSKIVEALQEKIDNITKKTKEIGARVAASMTLSTAIDVADRNKQMAQAINFALKQELVSLEKISDQLGEAETAKFEKKINKLSKQGFVHRTIVKVLKRKELTFKAVLRDQMKKILSYTNIDNKDKPIITAGSVAKGIVKNPKLSSDALGGPDKVAKAAAGALKISAGSQLAKVEAKHAAKKTRKNMDELAEFFGIKK